MGLHTGIVQAQAKPFIKKVTDSAKQTCNFRWVCSSCRVCKPLWCHQLKILLAYEIFLWWLNPRHSLTKPALGGAQINICNGKSWQKDKLYWVRSAVACFAIWLEGYWEGGCRLELTLTLNVGSAWGSSVHSLPLCKGTNAQQLLLRKNCSEILSWQQSMEELLGKLVNFNLPGIRMLT